MWRAVCDGSGAFGRFLVAAGRRLQKAGYSFDPSDFEYEQGALSGSVALRASATGQSVCELMERFNYRTLGCEPNWPELKVGAAACISLQHLFPREACEYLQFRDMPQKDRLESNRFGTELAGHSGSGRVGFRVDSRRA